MFNRPFSFVAVISRKISTESLSTGCRAGSFVARGWGCYPEIWVGMCGLLLALPNIFMCHFEGSRQLLLRTVANSRSECTYLPAYTNIKGS